MWTLKRFDKAEYIKEVKQEFEDRSMNRADDYFETCYEENLKGERITILAYSEDKLAGCCHLKMRSEYPYFLANNIPEINDLNVFPEYRNKGIAGSIIDELEKAISPTHEKVGIGVGLFKDYGTAQRLYFKKGYTPDGNGLQYNYEEVQPGTHVFVDDDLNLYYTKKINIR
jgi:GNAT superfamily N-acetyltransferase